MSAARKQFVGTRSVGEATRRSCEKAVRDFKAWNRRNPGTMVLRALDEAVMRYYVDIGEIAPSFSALRSPILALDCDLQPS